jgi:hypothetical protein
MHPSLGRIRHWLVRPIHRNISHIVFSDMSSYRIASLLHWVLLTTTSPPGISLLMMYALTSNLNTLMMELTIVFLLDGTRLDPLSPGCKHSGQPLRPWHGIRHKPWTRGQLQLVLCFQGKGACHLKLLIFSNVGGVILISDNYLLDDLMMTTDFLLS